MYTCTSTKTITSWRFFSTNNISWEFTCENATTGFVWLTRKKTLTAALKCDNFGSLNCTIVCKNRWRLRSCAGGKFTLVQYIWKFATLADSSPPPLLTMATVFQFFSTRVLINSHRVGNFRRLLIFYVYTINVDSW